MTAPANPGLTLADRAVLAVVAEGAAPVGGQPSVITRSLGRSERLGGVGEKVADELERLTGQETRTVVLGHLLRGGRRRPGAGPGNAAGR